MKKVFIIVLLIISVIVSKGQNSYSDQRAVKMLKYFYTVYITSFSNDQPRIMENKLSRLRKKYCTASCLKKYEDLVEKTDADAFFKSAG